MSRNITATVESGIDLAWRSNASLRASLLLNRVHNLNLLHALMIMLSVKVYLRLLYGSLQVLVVSFRIWGSINVRSFWRMIPLIDLSLSLLLSQKSFFLALSKKAAHADRKTGQESGTSATNND
jgi:hypothetical protein